MPHSSPCGIVHSNSGTPMAASRPRQPPRNEAGTIFIPRLWRIPSTDGWHQSRQKSLNRFGANAV
jgi:hypothetical protein